MARRKDDKHESGSVQTTPPAFPLPGDLLVFVEGSAVRFSWGFCFDGPLCFCHLPCFFGGVFGEELCITPGDVKTFVFVFCV